MIYNDCQVTTRGTKSIQPMQIYYKDNSRTNQLTVLAQQKVR